MASPHPRRVVIAGGGVAALEALLALADLVGDRVRIELLSPERHFHYRPLLVGEPFGLGAPEPRDLNDICSRFGADLRVDGLEGVDGEERSLWTRSGARLRYDDLIVAVGAWPHGAMPGAVTLRGRSEVGEIRAIADEVASGDLTRVAFVVPAGVTWPVPAYELALLTADRAARAGSRTRVALVTSEPGPLAMFGPAASEAMEELLAERDIDLHPGTHPDRFVEGVLTASPTLWLRADRVVALPRLEGPALDGLPHDPRGFIPVDRFGRVEGLPGVYAAGDVTAFPIKQGGLAALQADAVAATIAAAAGAPVKPHPFRPVLRGLLLTGRGPHYLRGDASGETDDSEASIQPLWWPPHKIVGPYLAPFLAGRADLTARLPDAGAVPIDMALSNTGADLVVDRGPEPAPATASQAAAHGAAT